MATTLLQPETGSSASEELWLAGRKLWISGWGNPYPQCLDQSFAITSPPCANRILYWHEKSVVAEFAKKIPLVVYNVQPIQGPHYANREAISVLNSFLDDDEEDQEETWSYLRTALDEGRTDDFKLFR